MHPRHFTRSIRTAGISALGLGVGLALTACGSAAGAASGAAGSATATPSASGPAGAAASTAGGPAAAASTTPTTAATLVPMQTATGGEFLSPSGNISCEVDYGRAGLTQVYCQTVTPARSVTMSVVGKYTTCTGQQCLGNPGTGTPTLAYGTATGVGPFRCASATAGVTCVAGGKGFRISTSGITAVPA